MFLGNWTFRFSEYAEPSGWTHYSYVGHLKTGPSLSGKTRPSSPKLTEPTGHGWKLSGQAFITSAICRQRSAAVFLANRWSPGVSDWHTESRCRRLTYGVQVPQADIRSPSAAGWHMESRCRRLAYGVQVPQADIRSPGAAGWHMESRDARVRDCRPLRHGDHSLGGELSKRQRVLFDWWPFSLTP